MLAALILSPIVRVIVILMLPPLYVLIHENAVASGENFSLGWDRSGFFQFLTIQLYMICVYHYSCLWEQPQNEGHVERVKGA